jgi:hypothetical protein
VLAQLYRTAFLVPPTAEEVKTARYLPISLACVVCATLREKRSGLPGEEPMLTLPQQRRLIVLVEPGLVPKPWRLRRAGRGETPVIMRRTIALMACIGLPAGRLVDEVFESAQAMGVGSRPSPIMS